MKILDKYILTKFLTTFLFVVGILVAIVLILTFSERNENFIKNEVGTWLIIKYFLFYAPYIANLITPITVFIAAVFVTSKMASHTEIVAILAGGVSYPRMLKPFLRGAMIIAVISFAFTGWIIPEANKFRVKFENEYFADKPFVYSGEDVHFKVSPTTYVYLRSYNNYRNSGSNFTLEEIVDKKMLYKISARQIVWDSTSTSWNLRDWNIRRFNELNEEFRYENVEDTLIKLNMSPQDFSSQTGLQETLTIPELYSYIEDLRQKGADNIPIYHIEKLTRFMSPFTAIILTFIGVILSSRKTRGGVGFQIALGFLLAFIYILLFIATKSIAEAGSMDALLAVWMPNIIFTMLGFSIYRFVPK
ncbi:LptF/LptG family permease [uncultured Roseivirga sp.]|uniref:LptF/LptG family permease n=1 Tax=uncultured Roseivirga sp. TaxID=543088 RepID=UPI0030DDA412|tara:strand:- start:24957 stop:26039 length:1083 start_codon:yes stop_codon:yes gene_type:complete